jgi:hypothetical protein
MIKTNLVFPELLKEYSIAGNSLKENFLVKNPAADTAGRPLFECLFFSVIPASEARRESFRKDSGQAGMTEIWNCG